MAMDLQQEEFNPDTQAHPAVPAFPADLQSPDAWLRAKGLKSRRDEVGVGYGMRQHLGLTSREEDAIMAEAQRRKTQFDAERAAFLEPHLKTLAGHTLNLASAITPASPGSPSVPSSPSNLSPLLSTIRDPFEQTANTPLSAMPASLPLNLGAPSLPSPGEPIPVSMPSASQTDLTTGIQPPTAAALYTPPTAGTPAIPAQPARFGTTPLTPPVEALLRANPNITPEMVQPLLHLAAAGGMGNLTTEQILNPNMPLPANIQEGLLKLRATQEGARQPLQILENMRDNLEAKLEEFPDSPTLKRRLREVTQKIDLETTRAGDDSQWSHIIPDPLTPGGYVGLNKKTNRIESIPIAGMAPSSSGATSSLTGDEFLKTIPKATGDQVKALAEGRLQFPAGFALKSPYWQNMLSMVSQYDPSFDAVNYNTRVATRKEFASTGQSGKSLGAASTLMGHLGRLHDNLLALNNTGFTGWNWLKNTAKAPFSPELKGTLNAVHLDQQAVIEEMERLWRGTGGNVTEIEGWRKSFSDADGPVAIKKGIQEAIGLANTRIETLADRYNVGMGTTKQGLELLSPMAQKEYHRLTSQQPLVNAVSDVPITATGPNGQKLILKDGQWVKP